MKGYLIAIIFIIGLALGIVGMIYGPDVLGPYMPDSMSFGSGKGEPVEGRVVAKLPRADKLLITVSTPEGASLVTFNQKVDEISLLVDEGDYITLKTGKYEPFVMNPAIVRVRKEAPEFGGTKKMAPAPEAPAPEPPAVQPAPKKQEQKTDKKQDKPASAAPQPEMKEAPQQQNEEKEAPQESPEVQPEDQKI